MNGELIPYKQRVHSLKLLLAAYIGTTIVKNLNETINDISFFN